MNLKTLITIWVITLLSMSNLSAQLSPTIMHHYFDNNSDKAWNLQYLIWETGVSSYLNLSEENKEFIQELANLIFLAPKLRLVAYR